MEIKVLWYGARDGTDSWRSQSEEAGPCREDRLPRLPFPTGRATVPAMDTAYMRQLNKLIRVSNKELDRAQEMNEPPADEFIAVVRETESECHRASVRFMDKAKEQV